MDIVGPLIWQFINNPQIHTILLGVVVKILVDQFKRFAVHIDETGVKQYKVPVQLVVTIFSALVSLGHMYLTGHLAQVDPNAVATFFTDVLPTYLNAMGIHVLASNVKEKLDKS